MPVVSHTLKDPSLAAQARRKVLIASLDANGFEVSRSEETTDSNGAWSVTLAAGKYTVHEFPALGGPAVTNITVPSGGGPYDLSQVLT